MIDCQTQDVVPSDMDCLMYCNQVTDSVYTTASLTYLESFCCEEDMAQAALNGWNWLVLDSHFVI